MFLSPNKNRCSLTQGAVHSSWEWMGFESTHIFVLFIYKEWLLVALRSDFGAREKSKRSASTGPLGLQRKLLMTAATTKQSPETSRVVRGNTGTSSQIWAWILGLTEKQCFLSLLWNVAPTFTYFDHYRWGWPVLLETSKTGWVQWNTSIIPALWWATTSSLDSTLENLCKWRRIGQNGWTGMK